jgi:hypothetical protein
MKVTYGMPSKAKAPASEKVPRVARLLALAHKFEGMLDRGEVESMADLARLGRVSRARITQIMDLLMLAPEIQEEVLFGGVEMSLRELKMVVRQGSWEKQCTFFTSPHDVVRRERAARRDDVSLGRKKAAAADIP